MSPLRQRSVPRPPLRMFPPGPPSRVSRPCVAVEDVAPGSSVNAVPASLAEDHVVAAIAADEVVATPAEDDVVPRRADDDVGAAGPFGRLGDVCSGRSPDSAGLAEAGDDAGLRASAGRTGSGPRAAQGGEQERQEGERPAPEPGTRHGASLRRSTRMLGHRTGAGSGGSHGWRPPVWRSRTPRTPCSRRGFLRWSGPGSDWRPPVFQTGALPTELPDRASAEAAFWRARRDSNPRPPA